MGQLRLKNTAVLIIGAAAGMIGCIQTLEAIKFITSLERLLTDKMFFSICSP